MSQQMTRKCTLPGHDREVRQMGKGSPKGEPARFQTEVHVQPKDCRGSPRGEPTLFARKDGRLEPYLGY